MTRPSLINVLVALLAFLPTTLAFTPIQRHNAPRTCPYMAETEGGDDQNEIVARRIIVKGDVQGGYYRSCVLNEAGRFRSLVGTMTPPDDSDSAEIYVEGKKKVVDGFVRWCKRADVGLSQVTNVEQVLEESPTGLYDGFYVKTH